MGEGRHFCVILWQITVRGQRSNSLSTTYCCHLENSQRDKGEMSTALKVLNNGCALVLAPGEVGELHSISPQCGGTSGSYSLRSKADTLVSVKPAATGVRHDSGVATSFLTLVFLSIPDQGKYTYFYVCLNFVDQCLFNHESLQCSEHRDRFCDRQSE